MKENEVPSLERALLCCQICPFQSFRSQPSLRAFSQKLDEEGAHHQYDIGKLEAAGYFPSVHLTEMY